MRHAMLAAMALVVAGAAPAFAGKDIAPKHTESLPTFDDCFRLAWVRGVHVERGELDEFNEDCMANRVPFASGMAVDSVVREKTAETVRPQPNVHHRVASTHRTTVHEQHGLP